MQPMLGAGSGYLLDDGEPMSVAALATKIWREPKQVSTDIDNLVRFDLLRIDGEGAVFDPVMANNLAGYDKRNQEKQGGGQIETCLNRHSSLSKDANPKLPRYSTVPSKVGHPTLRLGTTTGGAAPLQTIQNSNRGGVARPLSFGLTKEDIVAAQSEFPQHEVEKLLPRFVAVNEKMDGGVKASKNPLKWLKGFLKTQKGGKGVSEFGHSAARNLSKLPKLVMKESQKDEDEPPYWKVGSKRFEDDEHIEEMRNMPLQARSSADQWLCKLIGREWNTDAAFEEFGDGDLFYCDNAEGTVEGVTAYETRRESEKVEASVEGANASKPPEAKSPDEIAHEQFMARVATEKAAAADVEPDIKEIQPEPEPELTRPSHGDVREDGKFYSVRYDNWFPKDRWENLERVR
jgi:hypothetical protein